MALSETREEHGRETINGVCCAGPIILSIMALTLVAQGMIQYGLNPPADEGVHAFLFQLLMVIQLPLIGMYAATVDWSKTRARALTIMSVQGAAFVTALTAVGVWQWVAAS